MWLRTGADHLGDLLPRLVDDADVVVVPAVHRGAVRRHDDRPSDVVFRQDEPVDDYCVVDANVVRRDGDAGVLPGNGLVVAGDRQAGRLELGPLGEVSPNDLLPVGALGRLVGTHGATG